MGTIQNRVLQDRRRLSRISVQMECRFKAEEKEFGALMLDLSQGGALLSSTLLPPQGGHAEPETLPDEEDHVKEGDVPPEESRIFITLEAGGLKAPMTLSGTIRRSAVGMSEYGRVAQFGVEFENTPLELLRLISVLSSRRKTARISSNIECRFRSGDNDYEAKIIDLSRDGALLSSSFIPDPKSKILITVQSESFEQPLTIEGTVTRSSASGKNEGSHFGVVFENLPQEFPLLVSALAAERHKKQNTA